LCGPVGVGKTTLVLPLAEALGFLPLPERPEDNAFFAKGLADPSRWAFASEVRFLLAAAEAAEKARRDRSGGVVERPLEETLGVYVPHLQDAGGLSDDEVQTVTAIGRLGELAVGPPDVMVMLTGDATALWRRIRSRARPGEEIYDIDRVSSLLARYESWWSGWNACPSVTVNATVTDLRRGTNVAALADRIRDCIG
jgi:deoxyadenosine/deoxycytidine kinase